MRYDDKKLDICNSFEPHWAKNSPDFRNLPPFVNFFPFSLKCWSFSHIYSNFSKFADQIQRHNSKDIYKFQWILLEKALKNGPEMQIFPSNLVMHEEYSKITQFWHDSWRNKAVKTPNFPWTPLIYIIKSHKLLNSDKQTKNPSKNLFPKINNQLFSLQNRQTNLY